MKKKIKTNKIKCLNCKDIIESTYTHNYVECSGGQCAVDGGKEYLRRSWRSLDGTSKAYNECFEELSEYEDVEAD